MDPSNNQTAGVAAAQIEGQTPMTSVVAGQAPVAQGPQAVPMPSIPLPLPITKSPANSQASITLDQTTGFPVADDKDVIEPEWVHKAKAIVSSTSDDPYKQSEDLTVLKADYMQKRYNKIVKLK